MNFVIKQTELFLRALKTSHSIDQNLHCYFSTDGILFLSNYENFDDNETKKPTYFAYFNPTFFESMQTNSIHFKMPSNLSTDLQIKLQKLNATMDTIVFELNIRHIYPSLKALRKQIKKIEIQVYHSIVQFKMIVSFNDDHFTIECPILLLDETAQMEIIRKYMENRKHLNILEVDSEVSEYLKDYNSGDSIQFILKRNSIEIQSNNQNKKTNLELNSGLLQHYNFEEFQSVYNNYNTINIEPNVLIPFQMYGFKMAITKDPHIRPRIFISQDWDQARMVLKSITTLNNKIKIIPILDDESNMDELFDIIQEYNPQNEQSCEEQQLRKKVKLHVID